MLPTFAFALGLFMASAFAQQGEYQQCGGLGWSGPTACVNGTACAKLNDYYSHCLRGEASSSRSASTAACSTVPSKDVAGTKYWFSFGDSYTTTRFNSSGTQPALGNPLGNPPYPGKTQVGGENWIDFVTTKYNKTLTLTYNYAFGGATIDSKLVRGSAISLTDQVNEFLGSAATSAPWSSDSSLFSFWIGINDITGSFLHNDSRDAFSDTLMDAYFALVQKTYLLWSSLPTSWPNAPTSRSSDTGARNFLFINVPPVDQSPRMISHPASELAVEKTVIAGYNSKLVDRVNAFRNSHSGVTTKIWDSNSAFTVVLNNPMQYGFVNTTSSGQTGDFWGDDFHPSVAAHDIWGKQTAALWDN